MNAHWLPRVCVSALHPRGADPTAKRLCDVSIEQLIDERVFACVHAVLSLCQGAPQWNVPLNPEVVDGEHACFARIYARHVSRFSELIEGSRARAEADPGWLGSASHRAILAESLVALGISDVSLAWTRPGVSSWCRLIELMRAYERLGVPRGWSSAMPKPAVGHGLSHAELGRLDGSDEDQN